MKKRRAWDAERIMELMDKIPQDSLLHLEVHLAFICSLRAGEVVGIETSSVNFGDKSLWITQIVERVSDEAISQLPKEDLIKVFPKLKANSKSSIILKSPKTEGSVRKLYLTLPLLAEIKERMQEIERNKEFFGSDYHDYGLLICNPDGTPIEPKSLNGKLKEAEMALGQHRTIRRTHLACINVRHMSQNFLTMRQHGLRNFVPSAEISGGAICARE